MTSLHLQTGLQTDDVIYLSCLVKHAIVNSYVYFDPDEFYFFMNNVTKTPTQDLSDSHSLRWYLRSLLVVPVLGFFRNIVLKL